MMLHKRDFPFFKELTHIKPPVDDLLEAYELLRDRKNEASDFRFGEIRSELARSFPFETNQYDYVGITDIPDALKDTARKASPREMLRMAKEGTAPAMDDRLYTQIREDVPESVRRFLSQFRGQVARVRFATLKRLGTIYEHIDNNVTHTVRVHVPLITDRFNLFGVRDGETVEVRNLKVGHVYFVNTALSHFVVNSSKTLDRTHLVVNLNTVDDLLD